MIKSYAYFRFQQFLIFQFRIRKTMVTVMQCPRISIIKRLSLLLWIKKLINFMVFNEIDATSNINIHVFIYIFEIWVCILDISNYVHYPLWKKEFLIWKLKSLLLDEIADFSILFINSNNFFLIDASPCWASFLYLLRLVNIFGLRILKYQIWKFDALSFDFRSEDRIQSNSWVLHYIHITICSVIIDFSTHRVQKVDAYKPWKVKYFSSRSVTK